MRFLSLVTRTWQNAVSHQAVDTDTRSATAATAATAATICTISAIVVFVVVVIVRNHQFSYAPTVITGRVLQSPPPHHYQL